MINSWFWCNQTHSTNHSRNNARNCTAVWKVWIWPSNWENYSAFYLPILFTMWINRGGCVSKLHRAHICFTRKNCTCSNTISNTNKSFYQSKGRKGQSNFVYCYYYDIKIVYKLQCIITKLFKIFSHVAQLALP